MGGGQPHVLQVFQPLVGGVPAYVFNLASGLVERGWRVSVAAPSHAERLDEIRALDVPVMTFELRRAPDPLRDLRALRRLSAYVRDEGVDVVHGHSSKGGMIAAAVGRGTGVPSVYTPHAWPFLMQVPLPVRLTIAGIERWLLQHFHHAAVAVSVAERVAAQRWHVDSGGKLIVVRPARRPPPSNGLTRASARRALGVEDDRFTVAWVGRDAPQKRPEDLAPLARLIGPDIRILALGHGLVGSQAGEALIAAGGIVTPSDVSPHAVLTASDAFLLTSAWEGLPAAVLEAMWAGLPIVAYEVGGVPELVVDEANGFLVPVADLEGAAAKLRRLADDPALARRFAEVSLARAQKHFSFGEMITDMEDVYRCAIAGEAFADDPRRLDRRPPWAPPPNRNSVIAA